MESFATVCARRTYVTQPGRIGLVGYVSIWAGVCRTLNVKFEPSDFSVRALLLGLNRFDSRGKKSRPSSFGLQILTRPGNQTSRLSVQLVRAANNGALSSNSLFRTLSSDGLVASKRSRFVCCLSRGPSLRCCWLLFVLLPKLLVKLPSKTSAVKVFHGPFLVAPARIAPTKIHGLSDAVYLVSKRLIKIQIIIPRHYRLATQSHYGDFSRPLF